MLIFCALNSIIEYTNESFSQKGMLTLIHQEFHKLLGALLQKKISMDQCMTKPFLPFLPFPSSPFLHIYLCLLSMPIVADTNRFAALQSDDDDSFLEGKHVSTASKWVGGIRAPLIPLKIVRLKM
jgi:hypothetical protein